MKIFQINLVEKLHCFMLGKKPYTIIIIRKKKNYQVCPFDSPDRTQARAKINLPVRFIALANVVFVY